MSQLVYCTPWLKLLHVSHAAFDPRLKTDHELIRQEKERGADSNKSQMEEATFWLKSESGCEIAIPWHLFESELFNHLFFFFLADFLAILQKYEAGALIH